MMVFQEIVDSVRALSVEEQDNLIKLIRQQQQEQQGNELWHSLQRMRAILEEEGIFADEDDFANLRDRSPGREIIL